MSFLYSKAVGGRRGMSRAALTVTSCELGLVLVDLGNLSGKLQLADGWAVDEPEPDQPTSPYEATTSMESEKEASKEGLSEHVGGWPSGPSGQEAPGVDAAWLVSGDSDNAAAVKSSAVDATPVRVESTAFPFLDVDSGMAAETTNLESDGTDGSAVDSTAERLDHSSAYDLGGGVSSLEDSKADTVEKTMPVVEEANPLMEDQNLLAAAKEAADAATACLETLALEAEALVSEIKSLELQVAGVWS
jgi:hypothetical protein